MPYWASFPKSRTVCGGSLPKFHTHEVTWEPSALTTLIGSVHRFPASFLMVPYLWLQPLQSSSLTGFGAIAPSPGGAVESRRDYPR